MSVGTGWNGWWEHKGCWWLEWEGLVVVGMHAVQGWWVRGPIRRSIGRCVHMAIVGHRCGVMAGTSTGVGVFVVAQRGGPLQFHVGIV
jgi:hypothetical protein